MRKNTRRASRNLVLALGLAIVFSSALAHEDPRKPYGLIFGTAYGPDDRPLYGVQVKIHPVGRKRPNWDLVSDHHGEFAQRVPPGPDDYDVSGQVELALMVNGHASKKRKLKAQTRVHVDRDERQDVSLHFRE